MHRTRRQDTLVGQVRIAMTRRGELRTTTPGKAPAARHARHADSEQMARWENDGGAIVHTAGWRPRPLP